MPPQSAPWERDPVVGQPSGAAPWESDPAVDAPPGPHGSNRPSSMGNAPDRGWGAPAWDAVRDAIFGSPERREFEEREGPVPGSQPTTAKMVEAGLTGASFFGGPLAGARALEATASAAPGLVGKGARWMLSHPRTVSAAVGAASGELHGGHRDGAIGALIGATTGNRLPGGKMLRRLGRLGAAPPPVAADIAGKTEAELAQAVSGLIASGKREEARAIIEAIRAGKGASGRVGAQSLSAPAPALPSPPAVAAVAQMPGAGAPVVDAGKAAASSHNRLMAFAKDVAKQDPKVGEKIWMLLDDSGAPVKRLTSDQAAAAKRAGQATTWVKNLWAGGRQ